MEIRININNCAECPNYKFYKKCKVLNIKVNKNGINEQNNNIQDTLEKQNQEQ